MTRLNLSISLHVSDETEIAHRVLSGDRWAGQDYLRLVGDDGNVAIHFGHSPEQVLGNADRLAAAVAEIRAAAVRRLGHDPVTVDLARGDHYAGMPPAVPVD